MLFFLVLVWSICSTRPQVESSPNFLLSPLTIFLDFLFTFPASRYLGKRQRAWVEEGGVVIVPCLVESGCCCVLRAFPGRGCHGGDSAIILSVSISIPHQHEYQAPTTGLHEGNDGGVGGVCGLVPSLGRCNGKQSRDHAVVAALSPFRHCRGKLLNPKHQCPQTE